MNDQKIEDIKNGIRELMQLIAERGKPLSPAMKLQLAKVLEHAAQRIQSLRSEGAPPIVPELPNAPYPSSNIHGFQYDPKSGRLLVKFMGKEVADAGPVYSYDQVPPFIYEIFRRGAVGPKTSGSNKWHTWKQGVQPSHGAAMAALIKAGGFKYTKLS